MRISQRQGAGIELKYPIPAQYHLDTRFFSYHIRISKWFAVARVLALGVWLGVSARWNQKTEGAD